jgi:hypothetical protein
MSGYRIDNGVPFLVNDLGQIVGYVDNNGNERSAGFGSATPADNPQLTAIAELAAIGGGNGVIGMPAPSTGTLFTDWTNGTPALSSANGGGEAIAVDPTKIIDGSPALKITCGNTGTYVADYTFTTPLTIAQISSLQFSLFVTQNQAVFSSSTSLQCWLFTDASGTTQQFRIDSAGVALSANYQQSSTVFICSVPPGAAAQGWSFSGTPTPVSSTEMDALTIYKLRFIIAVPAGVAGQAIWLGPIRRSGRRKALVSLTFDGNYDSQSKFMLPMCEAQGIRTSLAVVYSGIGLANRLTLSDIDRAYAYGHEVIHHTFNGNVKTNGYRSSSDWPLLSDVQNDIQSAYDAFAARGWTRGIGYAVHGMTNPFEANTSAARQSLVAQAYRNTGTKAIRHGLGRGSSQMQPICNPSLIDPYAICGAKQATNTDNAASLTQVVTDAKKRGEWAIFTFHRSVITGPGSTEVLNSDFATFIAALGDDMRAGNVCVLPFSEAFKLATSTA